MAVFTIFAIGATGAQRMPVVRGLVSDCHYAVKVLTRDTQSSRAQELAVMSPKVQLIKGSFTSEPDLNSGLKGCEGLFLNIDGSTVGEKAEMFWTMRIYELAIHHKIKHFMFGNLEYVTKKGGYDPKYRTGIMIGESFYNMTVAILTTGPYIEMAISGGNAMAPQVVTQNDEEAVIWRVSLTNQGAVVHVSLENCAYYVRWLFGHLEEDDMDLEVAIEHIQYADLAAAFEKVTGCKARFVDETLEEYWTDGPLSKRASAAVGIEANAEEPGVLSVKENFTGFWNMWRNSGGENGVIKRDYTLLNKFHPNRIRTVEQFFHLADEKAKAQGSSLLEHVKQPSSRCNHVRTETRQ